MQSRQICDLCLHMLLKVSLFLNSARNIVRENILVVNLLLHLIFINGFSWEFRRDSLTWHRPIQHQRCFFFWKFCMEFHSSVPASAYREACTATGFMSSAVDPAAVCVMYPAAYTTSYTAYTHWKAPATSLTVNCGVHALLCRSLGRVTVVFLAR
jgi:hypothetical protein